MSAPVDVLAVMDDAAATLAKVAQIQMGERAEEMREARAAVAELIAADREYNGAKARNIQADNAILAAKTRSDDDYRRQALANHAYDRAVARRAAALARCGGGA